MKNRSLKGTRNARLLSALAFSLITSIACYHLLDPGSESTGNKLNGVANLRENSPDLSNCIDPFHSEIYRENFIPYQSEQPVRDHSLKHQFALPPLPRLAPQPVSHTIDNESGARLELASGSVIEVPAHAFIDATGKPVTEPVTLHITEYRNYQDIFLSGIPMKYGDTDQLESAGMVRLEANAGNSQVLINRNTPIRVMLESNNTGSDYTLYRLDENSGKWAVKGKDVVKYQKKTFEDQASALSYQPYAPIQRLVSLVSFEGVPEDKVFLWWRSKANDFEFSFTRLDRSYPELRALSLTKWKYEGEDAKTVYTQLFNFPAVKGQKTSRRGLWDVCEVRRVEHPGKIKLVLKSDQQTLELVVSPVDNSSRTPNKLSTRMGKYDQLLEKRIKFDQAHYEKYQADSIRFFASTTIVPSSRNEILRSFAVDRFGIWNVDKVVSKETYARYNVRFTDESGKELEVQSAYMADKSANTIFTYDFNKKPSIQVNRNSDNLLWFILPGDKLAVVYPKQLEALKNNLSVQNLTPTIRQDAFASMEAVREELNF